MIVNAPAAPDLDGGALGGADRGGARDLARADAGPFRGLLHPADRQRGRRGRGLARAHPRPALRAPFRPAGASAGARKGRRLPGANRRRRAAHRCPRRGGAPWRAAGGDRRRGGADLPLGVAGAVRAAAAAASRLAPRFEDDDRPEPRCWDGPCGPWPAASTAPRSSTSGCEPRRAGAEHFHWHIDIAPRLTVKAGFELGTGVDINIYPPERAAADLREFDSTGRVA